MTVAGNREDGEERGLARVHFDSISRSLEVQEADSYVHVEPSPLDSSPFPGGLDDTRPPSIISWLSFIRGVASIPHL